MAILINWQISKLETAGYSTQPSLAFSPSGQATIAYYSSISHEVRLGTLNADGTWTINSVDKGVFGDAGPSLQFRFDQPAISYKVVTYEGGDTSKPRDEIRYALWRGSSWSITRVAPVRGNSSLAFGPSHRAGVSYLDFDAHELHYAHSDAPGIWVSGKVDVETSGDSHLAFAPSGQPAIAYAASLADPPAYGDDLIKYASFDGATWTHEVVADTRYGDCNALAFSPSGEPAICYTNNRGQGYNNALVYAVPRGSKWQDEIIAHGADSGSLAFTPGGEPAASYHDRQAEAIKYAVFSNRVWMHFTVEAAGKTPTGEFVGPFVLTSLAFSPSGQPAVSYYDRADGSIKYAIGTVTQTVTPGWLRDVLGVIKIRW